MSKIRHVDYYADEFMVGVVGLGTWQLGAGWGEVSETAALEVLGAAV